MAGTQTLVTEKRPKICLHTKFDSNWSMRGLNMTDIVPNITYHRYFYF